MRWWCADDALMMRWTPEGREGRSQVACIYSRPSPRQTIADQSILRSAVLPASPMPLFQTNFFWKVPPAQFNFWTIFGYELNTDCLSCNWFFVNLAATADCVQLCRKIIPNILPIFSDEKSDENIWKIFALRTAARINFCFLVFKCANISCFQAVTKWETKWLFSNPQSTQSLESLKPNQSTQSNQSNRSSQSTQSLQFIQVLLAHLRVDFRAFSFSAQLYCSTHKISKLFDQPLAVLTSWLLPNLANLSKTSSQKLGRHALDRARSVWKSVWAG